MLFAILYSANLAAQDYHYAAVYDANGPVKEIKTESKNSFVQKKVKVGKDGRGGIDVMLYNDAGYPVGFELNMMGKQNFQKYFWNDECLLDSVAIQVMGIGSSELMTVKKNYNGRNPESQILRIKDGKGVKEFRMSFKDYTFDDRNNWITRTVSRHAVDADGKESDMVFEEKRTIKYYVP